MYSPGEPDHPKTITQCMMITRVVMLTASPGREVPNSATSSSRTQCHLNALDTSLLAMTCGTPGCRADHHRESLTSASCFG